MSSSPVTVAVTRTVKPGCEAAFERALHDFVQRSLAEPGQLGVQILRPPPGTGSREYGILRRFDSADARDAFYRSPLFADWEAEVARYSEGPPRLENVCGLEAWFTAPGRPVVPPPRWKMACVTALAVYPLTQLLPRVLHPLVDGWPRWAAGLLTTAFMVGLLTWIVMPFLARLFHPWLHRR